MGLEHEKRRYKRGKRMRDEHRTQASKEIMGEGERRWCFQWTEGRWWWVRCTVEEELPMVKRIQYKGIDENLKVSILKRTRKPKVEDHEIAATFKP